MAFRDYANETQSNIVPKDEFEDITREVFGVIANNLAKSLGPMGSSATIIQGAMVSATKDGYTILKNYCFHNRYKKMIYNLFRAPCTRLNNTVGDATTTAIVLTNEMYQQYVKMRGMLESHYRLPRHFTAIWDSVIEELKDRVTKVAVPLDPDDYDTIYNIAYVTSNGNDEVSSAVAKVYQEAKTPGIKKKDSPNNKSYIVPVNGYDFPANLISDAFITTEDMSTTQTNVAVMVLDHKVTTETFENVLKPIDEVMESMHHRLVVIAPFFDAHMCESNAASYIRNARARRGYPNMIMIQYGMGELEDNQLDDLAAVLRAKLFTTEIEQAFINARRNKSVEMLIDEMREEKDSQFYRIIGQCAEAYMTCKNGSIFRVEGIDEDEEYQNILRSAENDLQTIMDNTSLERQAYAAKIYKARARVLQLKMKNYIYYVGADSQLQKQILSDSIDDVIKCLRSATKAGTVPGCQISIMRACLEIGRDLDQNYNPDTPDPDTVLKSYIVNLIYNACRGVYQRIIHGPDGDGILKTMPRRIPDVPDGATDEEMTEEWNKVHKEMVHDAIVKGNSIIEKSIELNEVYDMELLEYNPGIITSAETDVMVLTAASELVKILISGNQAVILDGEVDESHEEVHQVWV